MYFATIPLWIFAAVIYFSDKKSKSNFWLSIAAFFAGLGGVSVFLLMYAIPRISLHSNENSGVLFISNIIICIFSFSCLLLYPYCFLLFGFHYSDLPILNHVLFKKMSKIGFAVPVLFIISVTPLTRYTSPDTVPPFINFIVVWALICFLLANFVQIYAYFKSKTSFEKSQRLLVCLLVTPSTLGSFTTSYASHWFGGNIWRYNNLISLFILAIFVLFAIRYGFLGLRLKIGLEKLDSRIRLSFLGTSALNHAIKNELQNVMACNQTVRKLTKEYQDQELSIEINNKLDTIQNSVDRLLEITTKINDQIKDLALDISEYSLSELIDTCIERVTASAQERNIKIIKNIDLEINILCDRIHMQEVFINILKNSLDSISGQGCIDINVTKFRNRISVVFKDDGSGISKENLKLVFEPFFSTKSTYRNFGLGLTYCFNVMRKHGGALEIESEEGKGTSVILDFSPRMIVEMPDIPQIHSPAIH